MRRKALLLLLASLLLSSILFAQAKPAEKKPAAATAAAAVPDKALMQKIGDAWATMNPDNVTKYYDQAPNDVFYDAAPLKYVGWAQYMAGTKQMFGTFKSLKFTVNNDAAVHHEGNFAFGTATVKMDTTDKTGKASSTMARWTAIWQNKGGNWVIVHDHFSIPMEAPK